MNIRQIIGIFLLSLYAGNLVAVTIDDIKVTASSLGKDCKLIEGMHPASIQAATLYPMITDTYSSRFKSPEQKFFQSFECSNKKGTIFYYQYANLVELESVRSFIESLIWVSGGPSKLHPELIENIDNVLVIFSSHDPQSLKKLVSKSRSNVSSSDNSLLFNFLNSPHKLWTLNHICVLDDVIESGKYTNQNMVDAIVKFMEVRWEKSRESERNNDLKQRDYLLGYVAHTVIDIHWPERIVRNPDGMIVRFKSCQELGGGQHILQDEQKPSIAVQNDVAFRETSKNAVKEYFGKYQSGASFQEVANYFRNGPLRISPGLENMVLGKK